MESMRRVLSNSLCELDKKCNRYLLQNKDNDFLLRFKDIYNKLFYWENSEQHAEMMRLYAQAVMDLTFYEENKLVEKDFAIPNAKEKLHDIIDSLSGIEILCKEYTDEPINLLGKDIVECLMWRKGALLYMYCATIEENENIISNDPKHFLYSLYSGIMFLKQMVKIRKPLLTPQKDIRTKTDMVFLLSEGIYNDTCVLGLMYAGEMCYWYKKHYTVENATEIPERFRPIELGKMFLEKYIKVTEGPLKGRGWKSAKAKELFRQL